MLDTLVVKERHRPKRGVRKPLDDARITYRETDVPQAAERDPELVPQIQNQTVGTLRCAPADEYSHARRLYTHKVPVVRENTRQPQIYQPRQPADQAVAPTRNLTREVFD